jgi:hypothetical protein
MLPMDCLCAAAQERASALKISLTRAWLPAAACWRSPARELLDKDGGAHVSLEEAHVSLEEAEAAGLAAWRGKGARGRNRP